jgi:hypothetical protein
VHPFPASGKALVFLTNNTACLPRRSPRCTKAVGRFRISTRVAAVRLTTMPGIGVFSALFVQAEILSACADDSDCSDGH